MPGRKQSMMLATNKSGLFLLKKKDYWLLPQHKLGEPTKFFNRF
jgi:hypothetical protein